VPREGVRPVQGREIGRRLREGMTYKSVRSGVGCVRGCRKKAFSHVVCVPLLTEGVAPISEREPGYIPGPGQGLWQLAVVKKRSVLSGNANEPGDGDGGPREGSLSCLTVSLKGTASCLAASFTGSKQHVCDAMVPSRVSLHCVHARKHSTMTLEFQIPCWVALRPAPTCCYTPCFSAHRNHCPP